MLTVLLNIIQSMKKSIYRIYGARAMSGSKLWVKLKKPFTSTNIEEARKLLYDKYFSSGDIKISDIALTFCTETYDEQEGNRE